MSVKHWVSKSLLWVAISFSSMAMAADMSSYRGMGTTKQDFPTFKVLQAGGFIAKKPEVSRYDYNDVFRIKNRLSLWGKVWSRCRMNICHSMLAVVSVKVGGLY